MKPTRDENVMDIVRPRENRETQDSSLRERAFTKDEDGHTWLHLAVIYECEEDIDKLMKLLESESELNDADNSHQTPLHLAILVKNPRISLYLLRAGADPTLVDLHGNTPLHITCELRFHEGIHALLKPVSQQDFIPLPFTPQRHSPESILQRRNRRGFYAIHISYFVDDRVAISLLIHYGADVNVKDSTNQQSVLHYAVEENNFEMVQFLVDECHADLHLTNAFNQTPLDMAESRNQSEMVAFFESRLATNNGAQQESNK